MRHHPNSETTGLSTCSKALGTGFGRAPLARGDQASSSDPDFLNRFNPKERTPMQKHLSKKRVVLAAIVTVALALASGVAYAYWTSGGSGAGSAAAGTTSGITVNQTNSVSGLYPGGPAVALSGN